LWRSTAKVRHNYSVQIEHIYHLSNKTIVEEISWSKRFRSFCVPMLILKEFNRQLLTENQGTKNLNQRAFCVNQLSPRTCTRNALGLVQSLLLTWFCVIIVLPSFTYPIRAYSAYEATLSVAAALRRRLDKINFEWPFCSEKRAVDKRH
jgi:hypothetical protein